MPSGGRHPAEGSGSNLFLVRNGQLITPPGHANILEGIIPNTIIELARSLCVDTIERPIVLSR